MNSASSDEVLPLVAEALMNKRAKEAAMEAIASTACATAGENATTAQFDVKIGDGMDIAIHGENGMKMSLFRKHS